jgi:hypothetical protein
MENAISFNTLAPMSKTRNSLQRSSESMKKTCAKNDVSASIHIYTYSYIFTRLCAVIHNMYNTYNPDVSPADHAIST